MLAQILVYREHISCSCVLGGRGGHDGGCGGHVAQGCCRTVKLMLSM